MRNILVLAYAISPIRGSEYAVAWNYVTNMSKDNYLTVIYGTSDDHMGEFQSMESFLEKHTLPNVTFIPVKPNRLANLLNWPNRHNFLVYTFYYAYKIWHKSAYKCALKLTKEEHFDLIHYVGPIGWREPGYLWKLPLPYVWGPIGGFNNVPVKMMKALPLNGKLKLGIRTLLNNIQMHTNLRARNAIKRADVLMTCSSVNQNAVLKIYGRNTICIPENAITEVHGLVNPEKFNDDKLKLIWIGRLDAGKSLIILLDVLCRLKEKTKLELHVVGDGPLRDSLSQYCEENGLKNVVKWHGAVPRKEVLNLLTKAHLHVITSVSEANTTVIWEAMSVGVPTLTVDHCGMHDTVCDRCGIKIPITNYEDVVHGFLETIKDLIIHREYCVILAKGTVQCAQNYTWDKRRILLNQLYDSILRPNHRENKKQ